MLHTWSKQNWETLFLYTELKVNMRKGKTVRDESHVDPRSSLHPSLCPSIHPFLMSFFFNLAVYHALTSALPSAGTQRLGRLIATICWEERISYTPLFPKQWFGNRTSRRFSWVVSKYLPTICFLHLKIHKSYFKDLNPKSELFILIIIRCFGVSIS